MRTPAYLNLPDGCTPTMIDAQTDQHGDHACLECGGEIAHPGYCRPCAQSLKAEDAADRAKDGEV